MKRSINLVLITLTAALFSVAILAAPPAKEANPKQQASYEVGFTSFVINDASRSDRPIAVYVWYPADAESIDGSTPEAMYPLDPFFGSLPVTPASVFEANGMGMAYQEVAPAAGSFQLVMFSGGWTATAYAYTYIGTSLASQGFVFAALTHYGDDALEDPYIYPTEEANPGEPFDHLATALYNRPRDVSLALDVLLERNGEAADLLYGAMDPATVVASGHSLGGYATMTLAGGDDEVCDLGDDPYDPWGRPTPPETCAPTLPDPRIKSIIPLDGSNQALWFYELARIDVPVMGMGQEWSALEVQGFADWQARQHAAFSGQPSYRVDVNNATHLSFASVCGVVGVFLDLGLEPVWWWPFGCFPDPSETHRLVTKYMVAFLTKQQRILTPGHAITSEPDIEFFVTEKRNPHAIDDDYPDHFVYFKHQSGKATAKAEKDHTNQSAPTLLGDQP